jgi:hypothetical protein
MASQTDFNLFNWIIVFCSEFKTTIAVLTLHEVCQILLAIWFSHYRGSLPLESRSRLEA